LNSSAAGRSEDRKVPAERRGSLCGVFANAKRVLILWSLREEEKSAGEIAAEIEESLQCTSQHLHLMKDMGVLDSRRDRQMVYHAVDQSGLSERCRPLLEVSQSGRRANVSEALATSGSTNMPSVIRVIELQRSD